MSEQQQMVTIEKGSLVETVSSLRSTGWRLVQICPTTVSDHYEMNYSFDKDRQFRNLRFTVKVDETVPSIGLIYGNAFLYENEIHDLFGITVENMSIDFHGTLYRTMIQAPFSIEQVKSAAEQKKEAKPAAETSGIPGKEHHG